MKRVPEPELMTEQEQVEAYGGADFEEPHSNFMALLGAAFEDITAVKTVLDLGSGAGDIVLRFAKEYPGAHIDAVDGSRTMLDYAEKLLSGYQGFNERVELIHSYLQDFSAEKKYDLIMSNSLLHHLHDPSHFWNKIREVSVPGTRIFVMDLMRPVSLEEAGDLMEKYTRGEPEVLKKDFYNSLLAAFEIDEVKLQIADSGLGNLETKKVSDRHLIVYGVSE